MGGPRPPKACEACAEGEELAAKWQPRVETACDACALVEELAAPWQPRVEVEELAAELAAVWLPCTKASSARVAGERKILTRRSISLEAAGSGKQAPPTGRAPAAPSSLAPELRKSLEKEPTMASAIARSMAGGYAAVPVVRKGSLAEAFANDT